MPEFAEAAFAMQPGTVGDKPVKSQFGWHVIKVEDRRQTVPTFEEKEPELREQLSREIVTALLGSVRDGATIELFNIDGTPKPQVAVGRGRMAKITHRSPLAPERLPGDLPVVAGVRFATLAARHPLPRPRRPHADRGGPRQHRRRRVHALDHGRAPGGLVPRDPAGRAGRGR